MPITSLGSPNYATLSAMLTPALFLTACGSLIISTSNRMSRIVDRIRVLNDLGDELDRGASSLDYRDERLAHLAEQLRYLEWRGNRIRYALTMLYLGFGLFVGTSLTVGFDVLLNHRIVGLPTALSMFGVSLMLASSVNLVREAHAALRSNRVEIRFYGELRDRRKRDRQASLST